MLKIQEPQEDLLQIYYKYVRNLKALFEIFSHSNPSKNTIEIFLNEIETFQSKLSKEYSESISSRIVYFINESIYNRQQDFFQYLQLNFFFDSPEDRAEEIDSILSTDLKPLQYESSAISYPSIYNKDSNIPIETLEQNHKSMSRFIYIEHFFLWFNDFLTYYQKTFNTLMGEDGILSQEWKSYIAIMAAATMENKFFMRILEENFLVVGGDETWLIAGLDVLPFKLKALSTINALLAHQPSKISCEEISKLKRFWNLDELTEALLIMIQIHKMCRIEDCCKLWTNFTNRNINNGGSTTSSGKELLNEMEEVTIDSITQEELLRKMEEVNLDETANENKPFIFNVDSIKQESFTSIESSKDSTKIPDSLLDTAFNKHLSQENEKFSVDGPEHNMVCSFLDFNWSDNGSYILQNLYPSGVQSIDEEITYIIELTSNSLGEKPLSCTSQIRRAIIYYIEKLFGYYHEDYNYANINKLLDINGNKYTKFIKNFCFYPNRITAKELKEMTKVFKYEEIMHIILLIGEVKARTQLIYVSKAVNEVMKNIE